jgi:hypothetical protein
LGAGPSPLLNPASFRLGVSQLLGWCDLLPFSIVGQYCYKKYDPDWTAFAHGRVCSLNESSLKFPFACAASVSRAPITSKAGYSLAAGFFNVVLCNRILADLLFNQNVCGSVCVCVCLCVCVCTVESRYKGTQYAGNSSSDWEFCATDIFPLETYCVRGYWVSFIGHIFGFGACS